MPTKVNVELIIVWALRGIFYRRGLGRCHMARRAHPWPYSSISPLYPRKQTLALHKSMSAKGQ
jgi:hypothetical protein